MPSSISGSETDVLSHAGHARPVPHRPVPARPWVAQFWTALALLVALTTAWEWRMRTLEVLPGDYSDSGAAWVAERRTLRPDDIAIVGDSRILFDTDLNQFAALTGKRPVQLALQGTNGRPFLENLAADVRFKGLVIVGIAEISYYRDRVGLRASALDLYRYQSPSDRLGYWLDRRLSAILGFLDDDYRLSKLTFRADDGWRPAVDSPYDDVWKMASFAPHREAHLWHRIVHDPRLLEHARYAWKGYAGPQISAEVIARTEEITRRSVAMIRAHGGEVLFVRPPSGAPLRVNEDRRLPRARGWDSLLKAADVRGIHADELEGAGQLPLPEFSHITQACARVFTDMYVRRAVLLTDRVHLLPDVPAPPAPADCR
jgi:hypothetical protein